MSDDPALVPPSAAVPPAAVPPSAIPSGGGAPDGRWDRETGIAVLSIGGFSLSLGASGLVLPLLAVAAGYDLASIGILTALSAVAQLGVRLLLPWLLTRFADRSLIVTANVMMVVSFALLLVSRDVAWFVAAQLLQGSARALFWTASQTHAVRGRGGVVRSLAIVQTVGNAGQLVGPAAAGVVAAQSLDAALAMAGVAAFVALVAGFGMASLAPFPPQERSGGPRIWRRPGVDIACWSSYSAGGWRAMLSSFVPVALAAGGQTPEVIGFVLMTTEATGLAASGLLLRRRPPDVRRWLELAVVIVAASLVVFPLVTWNALVAGIALGIGGIGSGLLMSLGPALASESVKPEERGAAIAVTGTFRAVALLVTPAAAAAALSVVILPVGLIAAALAIGAPPIIATLRREPARVAA